jgi:hypothetical protein
MLDLLALQSSSAHPTLVTLLYTLLLAFLLSSALAYVYEKTFMGLSYSRNFVQSIVLSAIVAATVMQAIGDNVGRGLGMMGALAIVRFRSSFKDPRDIMFLFASLGAGIGCGVFAWGVAIGGTVAFIVAALVLSRAGIGTKHFFDGLLRFSMPNTPEARHALEGALRAHLKTFVLVTLREMEGGARLDCAYQIRLKARHPAADMLTTLSKIEGLSGTHFLMQEATTEM